MAAYSQAPERLAFDGRDLPTGVYVVRAIVRHADGRTDVSARTVTIAR